MQVNWSVLQNLFPMMWILCYGRYIVDAKSMLGVLSLPDFAYGELQIPVESGSGKEADFRKAGRSRAVI